MLVAKSVRQSCAAEPLLPLMETFRRLVNDCIRIGLENNASTLKRLSKLCYQLLSRYNIISYYKPHPISKVAGILANRKQSLNRGRKTKSPHLAKSILVSSYGFKIVGGILKVPLGNRQYFDISLNRYTQHILSDPTVKMRSFTLTANNTVSVCYSKEVTDIECSTITGIDRNLRNLPVGNDADVVQYDLSKAVDIAENTRCFMRSFKRNDVRIRRKLASKYGQRRRDRVIQLLHQVSKRVVAEAKQERTAIAFERLTYIRRLY